MINLENNMPALPNHLVFSFCFAVAAVLSWNIQVIAAENTYVPKATLVKSRVEKLPVSPVDVEIAGSSAYIIGKADDSNQILKLKVSDLSIVDMRPLDIVAEDMIVSFAGKFVYVIGRQGDETILLVLNSELETLGQLVISRPIASPRLSLAETNLLVVAGARTNGVDGTFIVVDASTPNKPVPIPGFRAGVAAEGLTAAWLDVSQEPPNAFLNSTAGFGLIAVGFGEEGDFEYGSLLFGKGRKEQTPIATFALMPNRLCRGKGGQASFLIADSTEAVLSLATYDPDFKSLDVVNTTKLSLDVRPHIKSNTAESNPTQRLDLLASSCNQSVIWVSNRHSNELDQFAVNADLMVLEKVGTIKLLSRPDELAVSILGSVGLVISAEDNTVTQFQDGDGEIIGEKNIRELQRSLLERGYAVGTIDGIMGTRTIRAIDQFQKSHGVRINVSRDLDGALKTIQSISPKKQ